MRNWNWNRLTNVGWSCRRAESEGWVGELSQRSEKLRPDGRSECHQRLLRERSLLPNTSDASAEPSSGSEAGTGTLVTSAKCALTLE